MKFEVTMPDLSTASTTVKIMRWLVEQGEMIQRGQPLLEVETDKATMEVEAAVSDIVRELLVPGETEVEVGQAIAILDTPEAGAPAAQPGAGGMTAAVPTSQTGSGVSPAALSPAQSPGGRSGGMFARNRQRAGAAPGPVAATPSRQGKEPGARREEEPGARQEIEPGALEEGMRWSVSQRVVGQRMQESKREIPHYYLQHSANAAGMVARRSRTTGEKTVWDAYFIFAAARALKKFPRLKTQIVGGTLAAAPAEAVGVAVDLEDSLYVISISDPAVKTPEAISAEIRAHVQRLKEGDPEARKIRPSILTISNLGSTGVETFTAIINPPEAAILAVGKIGPVVVPVDGQVVIQERVMLTLSVDHRIVNGRYAAEFLAEIVRELEAL